MALSVTDVQNIVRSEIGGLPQMPAPDTLVEGRVVTPQVNSVCNLGDKLSALFADIDTALHNFINGIDDLLINPLSTLGNAVLTLISQVIASINTALTTASTALKAALNTALAALNAATTAVTAAIAYAGRLIGDTLNQVMASMSMCSPTQQVPSAKKYGASDLASTLNQQSTIQNIQTQVNAIQGIVLDTVTPEATRITQLNSASGVVTTQNTTLNTAVTNDQNNLAAAQLQNQGLTKITSIASGLNNDATSSFLTGLINPARANMLQGVANAMKT